MLATSNYYQSYHFSRILLFLEKKEIEQGKGNGLTNEFVILFHFLK
jgi:hypothetical protein